MADEPLHAYELDGEVEPQCLERIHELMGRLWSAEPSVTSEDRDMFATAVAEVAGNIVQHAAAQESIRFKLRLCVHRDQVEALFSDNGGAADIDLAAASLPADLAESGRGLALARAAADVQYNRVCSANQWRVVRRRTP